METFKIQNGASIVSWTGKKVLGLHTGTIEVAGGYIALDNQLVVGGEVAIDMTTIVVTDIEDKETSQKFLAHLQDDDFFAVDKHKQATLHITGSKKVGDNKQEIAGTITIKDIVHPITYISTVEIFTDFLHAHGEIAIDRTLYNIRYGSGKFLQNLGDNLIYDTFLLQFKIVAQRGL